MQKKTWQNYHVNQGLSLELTLPEGSSCKEMVHDQPIEEHYEEFIDPDTEMDVLKQVH